MSATERRGRTEATDARRAAHRLIHLVDRALGGQDRHARERVAGLRRDHPTESPAEILDRLTRAYLRGSGLGGGTVGAVAAVPGAGTLTAAALTTGQVGLFLRSTAAYVLAVAEVHGLRVTEPARRRTLVLAALLGKDGARAVEGELGLGTLAWGRAVLTRLPLGTVRSVNRMLSRRLVRSGVTRAGGLAVGRLAPFGVGAAVGWFGGRALARAVTEEVRESFGPPPADFASTEPGDGATMEP